MTVHFNKTLLLQKEILIKESKKYYKWIKILNLFNFPTFCKSAAMFIALDCWLIILWQAQIDIGCE